MAHNKMFLIIFLTTLFISWSRQTASEESPSNPSTTILDPVTPEEQLHLADAVNEFGYKLMVNMIKKRENKNIVLSPTGVAGLLAMTLLGTVGSAYDELAAVLGFSQDILTNRKNHEQFGQLLQQLDSNGTSSRSLFSQAIVVDAHTKIRQVYHDYLLRVYRGDTLNIDFNDSEKSTGLVNEWIKNQTQGKIENFLRQPLAPSTKLVLLSAIYFSGQWAQPFIPELTRSMVFKSPSGEITTDFMVNTGYFRYKFDLEQGFHIIALPYNDTETTMYVLVPHGKKTGNDELNLTELMARLDYAKINDVTNKMNMSNCVISFPKMELKTEVNLVDALQDLGVKSIFSPVDANFALMMNDDMDVNRTEDELITRLNSRSGEVSDALREQLSRLPNPGVHVNTVLHHVKMTVNEYGTEAVAASSAFISRSANLFYADSPFYMFIRNERTKLVTFSGAIFDPSAL